MVIYQKLLPRTKKRGVFYLSLKISSLNRLASYDEYPPGSMVGQLCCCCCCCILLLRFYGWAVMLMRLAVVGYRQCMLYCVGGPLLIPGTACPSTDAHIHNFSFCLSVCLSLSLTHTHTHRHAHTLTHTHTDAPPTSPHT